MTQRLLRKQFAPDQDVQGGWTGGPGHALPRRGPGRPGVTLPLPTLSQGSSYPSSLGLQTQTGALMACILPPAGRWEARRADLILHGEALLSWTCGTDSDQGRWALPGWRLNLEFKTWQESAPNRLLLGILEKFPTPSPPASCADLLQVGSWGLLRNLPRAPVLKFQGYHHPLTLRLALLIKPTSPTEKPEDVHWPLSLLEPPSWQEMDERIKPGGGLDSSAKWKEPSLGTRSKQPQTYKWLGLELTEGSRVSGKTLHSSHICKVLCPRHCPLECQGGMGRHGGSGRGRRGGDSYGRGKRLASQALPEEEAAPRFSPELV